MDLQHPAVAAGHAHGFEQLLIGQAEVVDHERHEGRDSGLDSGRGVRAGSGLLPRAPRRTPGVATRTLWHGLYDCVERSLDVSFYLGENPTGGAVRRSRYLHFQLDC